MRPCPAEACNVLGWSPRPETSRRREEHFRAHPSTDCQSFTLQRTARASRAASTAAAAVSAAFAAAAALASAAAAPLAAFSSAAAASAAAF